MYEVEKGIPVPFGGKNRLEFPLDAMEAGDSFVVPPKNRQTLINRLREYKSSNPSKEFITRRIGEEIRCWRIR